MVIRLSDFELAELAKIKKEQKEQLEQVVAKALKSLSYKQILDNDFPLLKEVLSEYLEADDGLFVSTCEFSTGITDNILVNATYDGISCQCQVSIIK